MHDPWAGGSESSPGENGATGTANGGLFGSYAHVLDAKDLQVHDSEICNVIFGGVRAAKPASADPCSKAIATCKQAKRHVNMKLVTCALHATACVI
jgi:hypothetical protein